LAILPAQGAANYIDQYGAQCGLPKVLPAHRHGAAGAVILLRPANWAKHSFGPWLTAAAQRLHHNVLATALANKLARIALTVLVRGRG